MRLNATATARSLDQSRRTFHDYMARPGAPKKGPDGLWDVLECARFMIKQAQMAAAGRQEKPAAGKTKVLDLSHERARLAREQADKIALENAVSRGELMPEAEVVSTWQLIITAARSKFLALPTKLAPILAPLTDPVLVQDKLTAAVHESLSELVDEPEYGRTDEDEDAEGDDETEGDETLAAAAPANRKPVGRQASKAKSRRKLRAG